MSDPQPVGDCDDCGFSRRLTRCGAKRLCGGCYEKLPRVPEFFFCPAGAEHGWMDPAYDGKDRRYWLCGECGFEVGPGEPIILPEPVPENEIL